MTVRNFPCDKWAADPMRSISLTTLSIAACGALGFITMITSATPQKAATKARRGKSSSLAAESFKSMCRPGRGDACVALRLGRNEGDAGVAPTGASTAGKFEKFYLSYWQT